MRNLFIPTVFDNFEGFNLPRVHQWVLSDNGYQLNVDVPGVKKEDVKIELEDGIVKISASRSLKSNRGEYVRKYQNTFSLPEDIDTESIEAQFDLGVLTLSAKRTEQSKAKTIQIK